VIYGVTYQGGAYNYGTIYSLTPPTTPGGNWSETILHSFTGEAHDGLYPDAGPVLGTTGTLYGVTQAGPGKGGGTVWALEPPSSTGGAWTLNNLHDFAFDGGSPQGGLTLGPHETLYGVTTLGGTPNSQCPHGCGTVFEIVR